MIILRKPSGPSQFIILAESPSGVQNEVNQEYTTSYMYRPGRLVVYYNGQAYHSPDDFEETGPSTFRLIHVYPDETDELRVAYEVDECNGEPTTHDDLDHYFLQLLDTPSNYTGAGGKYVKVKDDQTGLEFATIENVYDEFLELIDTPTTYSGSEGQFVKVNSTGTGLEFQPFSITDTEKNGIEAISIDSDYVDVTFDSPFASSNYRVVTTLKNSVDSVPAIYSYMTTTTTVNGFRVIFSGEICSNNYELHWSAKLI